MARTSCSRGVGRLRNKLNPKGVENCGVASGSQGDFYFPDPVFTAVSTVGRDLQLAAMSTPELPRDFTCGTIASTANEKRIKDHDRQS